MSESKSAGEEKGSKSGPAYMVLARKYRPSSFDQLIGQRAMVETLANAFRLGRIAQGFMLTGVRGVGKTTTARIIARALNYEGEGVEGPSLEMKEMGPHCEAIMESRHPDVMEMDAASHTGVDDIREIIESTRYKPISARYKVYIIDEVHMLSKSAFNALLKTLEEPPEHVKFIFATTEIDKVPVTVLSRCQRFDLKRVELEELQKHFANIAQREGANIDDEALALIARAAEGSVRDGLSILDQAIARGGEVGAEDVRKMLGLADRSRIFTLLEKLLGGDLAGALDEAAGLHGDGADPLRILLDLSEAVHLITRHKVAADGGGAGLAESERAAIGGMAGRLSLPLLSRCWQMLLKAIDECSRAPARMAAMEMALIRIGCALDLPSPEELARALGHDIGSGGSGGSSRAGGTGRTGGAGDGGGGARMSAPAGSPPMALGNGPAMTALAAASPDHEPRSDHDLCHDHDLFPASQPQAIAREDIVPISSFEEAAQALEKSSGIVLRLAFEDYVRPISIEPGRIELALEEGAPEGLAGNVRQALSEASGMSWQVVIGKREEGGETISQRRRRQQRQEMEAVRAHPLVKAALKKIKGAKIVKIVRTGQQDEKENKGSTGQ